MAGGFLAVLEFPPEVYVASTFSGLLLLVLCDATGRMPKPSEAEPDGAILDALDALPEPLAILDEENRLVWSNPAFLELSDELITRGDLLSAFAGGRNHFDVEAFRGAACSTRQGWVISRDGRHRMLETCGVRLPDGGLLLASRDVARRHQREEEIEHASNVLEEREAMLRYLLDSLPDLAFLKDREGRFLLVNRAFCEMLGLRREVIIGRTEEDFFTRSYAEKCRHMERLVLKENRAIEEEERFPLASGPSPVFAVLRTPLRDPSGGLLGIVGIGRDVTFRRAFEEQLRESEERYELAISGTMDGLWDWDIRTGRVYFSPRWKEISGIPANAPINSIDSLLETIHPDDRSIFQRVLNEYLTGQKKAFQCEFRQIHPDGTTGWVLCRGRALRREDGEAYRMAGSLSDITARKAAEQHLQSAHEETADLNRKLSDANESLEMAVSHARSMAAEAEKANQAKSDFLAHVSHDMRTPLNGIIGFIPLLRNSELEPTARNYLESLADSADSLLSLVNDLLDLAKIESGRFTLEDEPVDAARALQRVVNALSQQAHKKEIKLEAAIAESLPTLLNGDQKRINQILFNLIGNAIKFTREGHVRAFTWAEQLIEHPAEHEDATQYRIYFAIEDTGPGIPEEKLAQLFTPFEQVLGAQQSEFEGTGLGLTISRQLARLMGGDIRVESKVGAGSTFTFWYDTTIAQAKPANAKSRGGKRLPSDFAGSFPLRILVVDDSMVNREVLSATLGEMGYRAETATSGDEAMARYGEGERFDLCFMDYRMPGLDGIETADAIRAEEAKTRDGTPSMYICLLTADALRRGFFQVEGTSLNDYMTKPLNGDRLREVIQHAFAHQSGTSQDSPAEASPDAAHVSEETHIG